MSRLSELKPALDEGAHALRLRNGDPLMVHEQIGVYACLSTWGVECWGSLDDILEVLGDTDEWRIMPDGAIADYMKAYWAEREAFKALLGDIAIDL